MNLRPFSKWPKCRSLQNADVGLHVVGEGPGSFRQAWEARCRATRFHGFVDNLGELGAARRMGLVVEETGGGLSSKHWTTVSLQSRAHCRDKRQHDRLAADTGARLVLL